MTRFTLSMMLLAGLSAALTVPSQAQELDRPSSSDESMTTGPEVIRHFVARKGGFSDPLLADPDAEIIRAFGILNHNYPEGTADTVLLGRDLLPADPAASGFRLGRGAA